MKAIELFCGIGGFRLALDELGYDTVFSNDISKKATTVYSSVFGTSTLAEGDIYANIEKIPVHELLTAGFPCQPFSSAGKKQGIGDPRGTLFQAIVSVLEMRTPQFFVLENVKRLISMEDGIHFATILNALTSSGYIVEWRVMNASQFGLPQSRERILITGYRAQEVQSKLHLIEPSEGVTLTRDPNTSMNWRNLVDNKKSFKNWGICHNGMYFSQNIHYFPFVQERLLRSVLETEVDNSFDFTESTRERILNSEYVNRFYNGVQILYNQKGGARMGYSIFGIEGVAPTLTSTASRHYERYAIGGGYRRLTNVEYARIQGFPDNHCSSVSVYDQYALFGNAVPPPMVKWAIKRLTQDLHVTMTNPQEQMELFANV